jgi:hypothetical protein
MKFRILFGAAVMVALSGAGLVGTTGIASAAPSSTPYTCTGGEIPSGNYASITVTGACSVGTGAVISVVGNVNVAAGAVLDAQSAPSTITVEHNVTAAPGSILGMGCQPTNTIGMFAGVPCAAEPTGHTVITVDGNVTATDANTVILRGMTINGNVTLTGGGGDIPWAIKGNTIGGNVTISGVTADWLGVLFDKIGGNATLTNITATDPGDVGRTVGVVFNTVGRNLNCTGLAPGVDNRSNQVVHNATGQCASLV